MKVFEPRVCISCAVVINPTGPAQKRCTQCAADMQRLRVREANQELRRKRGKNVGAGSGAHNTPGEKHPQWAGGERKFEQVLAPAYFKAVRYCGRCSLDLLNAAPAMRAVHHKDHNRKNNSTDNFELLCKRCHQVEHMCWINFPNNKQGATTIP